MTTKDLKTVLANNGYIIADILERLGAHHITVVENKRVQFGMSENSGGRAHCIFLDTSLTHKDYPNGITEDFIQMISRLKNISYNMASNFISLFITGNIKYNEDMDGDLRIKDIPLQDYDTKILDTYPKVISELFMNDGIPPSVQSKFGIRFSDTYNRILIPIFQKNKLVGLFGRYNEKKIEDEFIPKYFPILPYQKGKVLYPYDINKEAIKKSKTCYLVESEKTPMIADKYGWNIVLALGGNTVKIPQVELLKELGVKRVVVCLDKGLGEGFVEFVAIRLKEEGIEEVYYIDVDNIPYLPEKECVFDLNDAELISETIRKYIRKVEV